MLEAQRITKDFKSGEHTLRVLKEISFRVESGQFVSIIGRSGSGKSTLLYQLSLLDRPTSGSIVIDGKAMEGLNSEERTQVRLFELGYIFQDYALVPTLSAIENVMVPLLMQGKDNALAVQSATDALTRVGLSDKLSNLPSQLSGGQQQRVSIARAIAHKPKIIFADEPTANLDSESSEMIIDVFKKLNQEGQTIVMVTHEMEYAEKTHRIIRLSDGVIISDEMNKKGKLSNTKTA